ncbi:MAG: VTC domain-containing protein [Bacteroidota bacterium]
MPPLNLEDLEINRIALADLPVRAQLMRRVDRKFRIGAEHLDLLFRLIGPHYSLVQAGAQDASLYINRYWDGIDRPFFHAHRVRKPRRYKFRQRTYAADGMSFWELKERLATGYTRKTRLEVGPSIHADGPSMQADGPSMQADGASMQADGPSMQADGAQVALNRLWNRVGVDPPFGLQPALDIHYKRLSFVHNNGHERLTLDYDLCLSRPIITSVQGNDALQTSSLSFPPTASTQAAQTWLCSRELYILELKQDRPGPSILDPLRQSRCLQAISFSKYYIGSLLWQAHEQNHQAVRAIPTRIGYGRAWTMNPTQYPLDNEPRPIS